MVNDEYAYQFAALGWIAGESLDVSRPPLTAAFCSAVLELLGGGAAGVRLAMAVVATLIVPAMYLVARELGGRRTGLIAAALGALHPTLVGFSHYILSETLFLVVSLPALWLLLRQLRDWAGRRTLLELAGIGVCAGLAALTREVGLVLLGALAIGCAWVRRAEPRRATLSFALVLGAAALVIAPWSLHLQRTTGDFALVSRTTWMNLYLGNPPAGEVRAIEHYQALASSPIERESEARRQSLAAIRERMPFWPLEKLGNAVPLLAPTSYVVKHLLAPDRAVAGDLGTWRYQFAWAALDAQPIRRLAAWIAATSAIAVALLGVAGLALRTDAEQATLLGGMAAALVLPVLLAFAITRFRLPLEPILLVGTALLLDGGRAAWSDASGLRRAVAVGSLLA
jgi:4-amino-4-deoxy-L-arabinose transferase-like glycosyltransferase